MRGRYGYLLGSLGSELYQPLSLPIVVTAVHTFVGGPASTFWLHGRDDEFAGSLVGGSLANGLTASGGGGPAGGGPVRRQYSQTVEFEVSGRNVDRALAPRGHFPGNEPVRGVIERRGEAWSDPLHPRRLHASAYSSTLLRPAARVADAEEDLPVWWQLFGPQEPAGLARGPKLRRAARAASRRATYPRVMDRGGALRGAVRPQQVAVDLLFEDEELRVTRQLGGRLAVAERRGSTEAA